MSISFPGGRMKTSKTLMILLIFLSLTSLKAFATEADSNSKGPIEIDIDGEARFCFTEQDVRDIGVIILERNAYRTDLRACTDDLTELREQVENEILPDLQGQRARAQRAEIRLRRTRVLALVALLLGFATGVGL